MIFRKANNDETQTIYEIYTSARNNTFSTWDDEYPSMANITNDIEKDNLFVLELNKKIIGTISIVDINELDDFDCWKYKDNVCEFARVSIKKTHQSQGLAKYLVSFILDEIKRRGHKVVHISVAKNNKPALNTYIRLGFENMAETKLYGGTYYLMEKKI